MAPTPRLAPLSDKGAFLAQRRKFPEEEGATTLKIFGFREGKIRQKVPSQHPT
jgi:hypothetical protein